MDIKRINNLRKRFLRDSTHSLADISKVLIILTAPRSGSSLLFSLLKRQPMFYSPSGENTPFYRLHGLQDNHSEYIDPHVVSLQQIKAFEKDFISDLSSEASRMSYEEMSQDDTKKYLDDLFFRFSLQWAEIDLDYDIFAHIAQDCIPYLRKSTKEFYLNLIKKLRFHYPSSNPYY